VGCGHIAGPTTCSGTLACAAAGTYKQSMCCIAIRGPGTGLVTVPICTAPPCQCSRVSNGSLRPLLTGSLSEPCKDSCTRVLSIEEGQGGGGGGAGGTLTSHTPACKHAAVLKHCVPGLLPGILSAAVSRVRTQRKLLCLVQCDCTGNCIGSGSSMPLSHTRP